MSRFGRKNAHLVLDLYLGPDRDPVYDDFDVWSGAAFQLKVHTCLLRPHLSATKLNQSKKCSYDDD